MRDVTCHGVRKQRVRLQLVVLGYGYGLYFIFFNRNQYQAARSDSRIIIIRFIIYNNAWLLRYCRRQVTVVGGEQMQVSGKTGHVACAPRGYVYDQSS